MAEGKFKLNDIGAVVTISSKLHLRYEEFSSCLFNSFKKKYTATKTADDPGRLKIDMKLIADLTVNGIFSDKLGLSMIHHELKTFVEMDKGTHEYANILISICKNIGEDIFGFIPSRLRGVFKFSKLVTKVGYVFMMAFLTEFRMVQYRSKSQY